MELGPLVALRMRTPSISLETSGIDCALRRGAEAVLIREHQQRALPVVQPAAALG